MTAVTYSSEKNEALKEFKDRQKFDKKFQIYGTIIFVAIVFLISLLTLTF